MLTLSLGIMENCQTWRLNFSVGVMAGKTGECKCTTQPHLTPDRVLNAETNEKPFLDCIFDSNNLSAHIMMLKLKCFLTRPSRVTSPCCLCAGGRWFSFNEWQPREDERGTSFSCYRLVPHQNSFPEFVNFTKFLTGGLCGLAQMLL